MPSHHRRRPARTLVLLVLFTLLTAGALAGCAAGPEAPLRADQGDAGEPGMVVTRATLERTVLLTGELEAAEATPVTVPRIPTWRVEVRWLAQDGSLVEEGDRLAQLDSSQFFADLEEDENRLAERLTELERRRAEARSQEEEKLFALEERRAALEKAEIEASVPEGIVAAKELADRRLALERARIEYAKAEEDLASTRAVSAADLEIDEIEIAKARREIAAARRAIEQLTLRAPRSGVFLVGDHPWQGRDVQVGDTVYVGFAIGNIPDLSSLVVDARLPDVDDGEVEPGMEAAVVLDAYPDEVYSGTVREVTAVATEEDPESPRRFFEVVVALADVDPERMIPGMSARVEVLSRGPEDALVVPRASLLERDGQTLVARRDGEPVPARTVFCDLERCAIEVVGNRRDGTDAGSAAGSGAARLEPGTELASATAAARPVASDGGRS